MFSYDNAALMKANFYIGYVGSDLDKNFDLQNLLLSSDCAALSNKNPTW